VLELIREQHSGAEDINTGSSAKIPTKTLDGRLEAEAKDMVTAVETTAAAEAWAAEAERKNFKVEAMGDVPEEGLMEKLAEEQKHAAMKGHVNRTNCKRLGDSLRWWA